MFYNNLLYEHKNSVKNSFALFCTSTYNFTTVRVGVVVDTCHNALNCFKNPIAIYKCYKGFFCLLHCLVVTLSQTLNFTLAVMSELSPPPPLCRSSAQWAAFMCTLSRSKLNAIKMGKMVKHFVSVITKIL